MQLKIEKNHKSKSAYFKAKRVWSSLGPKPIFHKAISGADFAQDIDEKPHRKIGHISREEGSSVGDGNTTAAALSKIYVVEASASSDDET